MFIASFYKFVQLQQLQVARERIAQLCSKHDTKGTVLLATEGINASIGTSNQESLEYCVRDIQEFLGLNEFVINRSLSRSERAAFSQLNVRIRDEMVTFGMPFDFTMRQLPRADLQTWTKMLDDPNCIILDIRNEYEVRLGRFTRSISPNTQSFAEFRNWVDDATPELKTRAVGIYCTGGVRCEKAAQFLDAKGIQDVTQLHGGILSYLGSRPNSSRWDGECFVFDKRVSVTSNLQQGTAVQCHGCRSPVTEEDRESRYYEEGISCPRCWQQISTDRRARLKERRNQIDLARERNESHAVRRTHEARTPSIAT